MKRMEYSLFYSLILPYVTKILINGLTVFLCIFGKSENWSFVNNSYNKKKRLSASKYIIFTMSGLIDMSDHLKTTSGWKRKLVSVAVAGYGEDVYTRSNQIS